MLQCLVVPSSAVLNWFDPQNLAVSTNLHLNLKALRNWCSTVPPRLLKSGQLLNGLGIEASGSRRRLCSTRRRGMPLGIPCTLLTLLEK